MILAFLSQDDNIEFEKTLKYHNLSELQIGSQPHYARRGHPNPEQQPTHNSWHIQVVLIENPVTVGTMRKQAGRFIIATNSVDSEKWVAISCPSIRDSFRLNSLIDRS